MGKEFEEKIFVKDQENEALKKDNLMMKSQFDQVVTSNQDLRAQINTLVKGQALINE
jgi:hypothetical protein